jgi:D-tyrosyl-tRNA(Tyr) deacylase
MKVFVQRVKGPTSITSRLGDGRIEKSEFNGPGLVVLLGWMGSDSQRQDLENAEEWLRTRIIGLRIFPDAQGKMNLSLNDYLQGAPAAGGILWVPQFTLAGKLESGFRPSFAEAMAPASARLRYEDWIQKALLEKTSVQIHGHFGADMDLSFTNWGPVSLLLEK